MSGSSPDDGRFERGHVVWHDGLFRQSGRPWLVVSGDTHPFAGEEYLVTGITTTDRPETIELTDEAWAVGGLPRTSYVSPWFLTTLKHADIERGVGALTDDALDRITTEATRYLK